MIAYKFSIMFWIISHMLRRTPTRIVLTADDISDHERVNATKSSSSNKQQQKQPAAAQPSKATRLGLNLSTPPNKKN